MNIKDKIEEFKEDASKKHILTGMGVLIVLFAGAYALTNNENKAKTDTSDNWQQIQLQDVSSDETYTIGELEKPVLVETFAVWCPTCTNQQQQLKEFHNQSNVTSVSLDVDPNEDEAKVQQHIDRYGFDWRYSIAPSSLTRQLINEYGSSIAQPPIAPMILICENGTRRLPNGVKPPSKLSEELQKGC